MKATGLLGGCLVWLVAPLVSSAADPDGVAFFEQKIRPVLVKECYSCHSADAKKLKGGLRLDSKAGLLAGGDSGPALVPESRKTVLCSTPCGTTVSKCLPRGNSPNRSPTTSSIGSRSAPR